MVSSKVVMTSEPMYRRFIAVDETRLSAKESIYVYVWSAVDADQWNY
jgi:hypothetical protein